MLVSTFKFKFQEQLKSEYPSQEVQSFFYLLTESILGMSRLDLALDNTKTLSVSEKMDFEEALSRLLKHEPIQYIIGETDFFGFKFLVNKNVLIPRPETEELVQWIIDDLKKSNLEEPSILDIGTGSGCIAVSLAKMFPKANITAIDISEEALKLAKANAERNNARVNFVQQDILSEEISESYDIIVSNPPYVRELEMKEMDSNVLDNEPKIALYVKDEDPLLFYRRITRLAAANFGKSGNLYFEINQYLSSETEQILAESGFSTELRKDIFGNFRMLKGEKSNPNINSIWKEIRTT